MEPVHARRLHDVRMNNATGEYKKMKDGPTLGGALRVWPFDSSRRMYGR